MTLTTSMASAVEHVVYLENQNFFPKTVYFQVGDTVRFQNTGSASAKLKTTNMSRYQWLTDPISRNASTTITMTSASKVNIAGPYYLQGSYYFGGMSYRQRDRSQGMTIELGVAPNACPDSRLPSNVCP